MHLSALCRLDMTVKFLPGRLSLLRVGASVEGGRGACKGIW